jgi:hypothetical protein
VVAACDTKSQFEPSLPPAAGFRVDDGRPETLDRHPPCAGAIRLTLIFDTGAHQRRSIAVR